MGKEVMSVEGIMASFNSIEEFTKWKKALFRKPSNQLTPEEKLAKSTLSARDICHS